MNFLVVNLGSNKLNAQAHGIAHHDAGQQGYHAIEEHGPERCIALTNGQVVLVADVVHAEQQAGQQRHHNRDHGALQVVAIMNMCARMRCSIGREQECLHAVIHRLQLLQLAARHKRRLDLVHIFS